jgi:hypothetical protein
VGFDLQGMRPAVAQAAEWWQGAVLITEKQTKKPLMFLYNVLTTDSSDSLLIWKNITF